MSGRNNFRSFPAPTTTPIIGQPFTLTKLYLPVYAELSCNCGGPETSIRILASVAAPCTSCGKVFNATFNPTTGQTEVSILVPKAESAPS